MVDILAIGSTLLTVVKVIKMAFGGLLDDKPVAKQIVFSGVAGLESALEAYGRLEAVARKIETMPEGADFTMDDLRDMGVSRDEMLEISRRLAAEPQQPSEAPIE